MNYSTILRVIGQVLEPLRPEAYEVVCYGDSYLVRCRVKENEPNKQEEEKKIRGFPAFLRLWREEKKPPSPETPAQKTFMNAEFLYSLEDIERLDKERRPPERNPDAMPDPYSFSNTLRTVGELLDRKTKARLLLASNRGQEGQQIVILYETGRGIRTLEEFPLSGLYDLWVQRYMKKKK
jgi:hypothetical protein